MNIFSWIFLGLFTIDFILHMVFYFKKFQLAAEFTGVFSSAFSCFFVICLLINHLPDSWHLITFSSIAIFLFSAGNFLKIFGKTHKVFITAEIVCFAVSCYVWTALLHSIFYLVRVPAAVNIAAIVIFLAAFIILSIYTEKNKISGWIKQFLMISGPVFITYCSTTCLIADPGFYSITLTTGTVLLTADLIFISINNKLNLVKNQIFGILFKTILPAAAEILITAGSFLMII